MQVSIDSLARIPKEMIDQTSLFMMKRRLVIVPRATSYGDNPEPICLYEEDNHYISVPREYFFELGLYQDNIIWNYSLGQDMQELPAIKLDPRRNQPDLVRTIERHLRDFRNDGSLGGILNAATGTGKTIMGIEIARRLGRATLIVVYKDDLADQWIERITTFFPTARIGRIQGDTLDYKDKDFVLIMAQTAVSRRDQFLQDSDLINAFGLLIVDEIHRFGSALWGSVAPIFNSKWRLGLSATVRRKDGCENVFKYHVGKIIASSTSTSLDPEVYFYESGFRVSNDFNIDALPVATQLKILSRNVQRNRGVAKKAVQAAAAGRKVIVLSKFVDHLQNMEALARGMLNLESKKNHELMRIKTSFYVGALYTGETRVNKKGETVKVKQNIGKEDLELAAKADIIFATYKKAEDALDIPSLDTLIMSMPISDPEQACGRILRLYPDKKPPIVVDVCDNNVKFCSDIQASRVRLYERKKWKMKYGK